MTPKNYIIQVIQMVGWLKIVTLDAHNELHRSPQPQTLKWSK